jgi:cobalt-zinc-cadmium efflux system membrane fusion protein
MSNRRNLLAAIVLGTLVAGCDSTEREDVPLAPTPEAEAIDARGPNNGRILRAGDLVVELAIYETGVPPEFRAWVTDAGRPVDPAGVDLEVRLTRLGDKVDHIEFRPAGDYLRGMATVYEPHSFSVSVEATADGETHAWEYESFEGRTRISAEMAAAFGLETMLAGPAVLTETVTLYGRIVPNADRMREVSARFDGAIRSVAVSLGESVAEGQALATVESNESLSGYTIVAPIAGVVAARNANPGEQTNGRVLFTVVDTSSVWAELDVFLSDRARVRTGAAARITATSGSASATGAIGQLGVFAGRTQAIPARLALDNADGAWTPGMHISGAVAVAEIEVPLAVKRSGLQSFRDFTVVYAQVGDQYEVRMLELGREAGEWVEVLGGLEPGTRYVTENSYVLKADIEKSGASHDH